MASTEVTHRAPRLGIERHDMRRTAVRNPYRAGVLRSVAMTLVGHKTEAMYRRDASATEADLQVAGERLGALFTSVFTSSAKQA